MAFIPALLLLPAAVLTFQGQTGVRARFDPNLNEVGLDLLAAPGVNLEFSERRWHLTLGTVTSAAYLSAFDETRATPNIAQSLNLNFTRNFRLVTVTLTETGQIGRADLRLAPLTGSAPGDRGDSSTPLPPSSGGSLGNGAVPNESIWFGTLSINLGVTEEASPTVSLSQFVRAQVSSSLETGVTSYPRQYTGGGGVGLSLKLTARDTIMTQAYFERIKTEHLFATYSLGFNEVWSHMLTGRLTTTLGLGLSYYFPESAASTTPPSLLPTVTLGLELADSPITASVTLTPVVDRYTGQVDTRLLGQLQYSKTEGRLGWFVNAGGGASVVPTSQSSYVGLSANAGLQYELTKDLELSPSVGTSYQFAPAAQVVVPSWILTGLVNLVYTPRSLQL